MSFKLTDAEKAILKKAHRGLKDKKNADKIKSLILLSDGYSYKEIESILLIDERTIQRYREIYSAKGIDELLKINYEGGSSILTKNELVELSLHIEDNLYFTSNEICNYVEQRYGKKYTFKGMTQTLKRLGFSYKKTKLVSEKVDIEAQDKFVKDYAELIGRLGPTEKVYFIDGVHPTHNVISGKAWIKIGTDKTISCNTGRQRLNINGAYSPSDQEVIVREDKTINSESTINLFKQIEEKHPELTKIIIIRDNAKYYLSKDVLEYISTSKIEYFPLPTYSPNLNLIERLWKFFKEKVIYNQYYEKFNIFRKAIMNFFENEIHKYKDELKVRLIEKFHIVRLGSVKKQPG